MSRPVLGSGRERTARLAIVFVLVAVAISSGARTAPGQSEATPRWVLGVSDTLVGRGWGEQMRREEVICSIKAQALASGAVRRVVVANRGVGPAEQSAAIRELISAGADAIIVNPSSPTALNPVIARAAARGIKVISIDRRVTAPQAYHATNDQVAYGRLGAEWLFETLGGKGNVVEMRGVPGVPADTDRHTGFTQALKRYPGIEVVKQTFTGWQYAPGGRQMLDILNSRVEVDGVWTSGIDYTVVNAFRTAGTQYVPIVGADTNAFLRQQLTLENLRAAAVTNPAAIGGVGAAIAIRLLQGQSVPKRVTLTPQVWDNKTTAGLAQIRANYSPGRPPTSSARLQVKPWTTYTKQQLLSCKGP